MWQPWRLPFWLLVVLGIELSPGLAMLLPSLLRPFAAIERAKVERVGFRFGHCSSLEHICGVVGSPADERAGFHARIPALLDAEHAQNLDRLCELCDKPGEVVHLPGLYRI